MSALTIDASRRRHLLETSNDAAAEAWNLTQSIADGEPADGTRTAATIAALNGVRLAVLAVEAALNAATAPPAIDVQAVQAEPQPPLATWAYLELMGHRVIVGYLEEDELAGRRMLRVRRLQRADRNPGVGEPTPPVELEERWRIYSPASVFSMEPLTEREARDRYVERIGYSGIERDDDLQF